MVSVVVPESVGFRIMFLDFEIVFKSGPKSVSLDRKILNCRVLVIQQFCTGKQCSGFVTF